MPEYDVVLLTEERYETAVPGNWYIENIFHDDGLLMAGLEARGLRVVRVAWSRPGFDWTSTRAAMFRTTWDYFDRFAEFNEWMDRVVGQTRLLNSPALVRWNVDKHYLRDLAGRGVNIPPTRFIEPGHMLTLRETLAETGWAEAILKPAVSGAARHTYRLTLANVDEHEEVFRGLVKMEAMLLQPFLGKVLEQGELSLVVIGGQCTHAVRKIAKPGDFRVHDDHGGTVHPHVVTAEEVAFAERAVAACPEAPLYARVDVVRDDAGRLSIMELELVEPELFLRFHPPAADVLAQVLAEAVRAG